MLRRTPMTLKPAKCKHCRKRLERVGEKLHQACVDPWLSANREKLRAKAALIVPGPPRNPVRLSDGRLVVVHVVDFYAKPQ